MIKTSIETKNGRPFISACGKLHYPLAYTAYFEECGEFSDFIKSGYKMFFVNVSFTTLPINNVTGFSPFRTGVFEGDVPDYSEFDSRVLSIVSMCPDAMIFPRINIAMPKKWMAENSHETVTTKNGGARESFCSDVFLRDGAKLLEALVSHIRSSEYSHTIAGYQLCGGTTQEWMHHDLFGSFSETGMEKFRKWMADKYGASDVPVFAKTDFTNGKYSEFTGKYGEFCCETAAKTAEHFSRVLKDYINGEQIVGVFYGYSAFVSDYLTGLHGLRHIIDSPYIDFFSSPCAYDDNRSLGIDWGDMIPAGSVKVHGKLCFVECDIRTHLTRSMQQSRPDEYPDGIYTLTDENGNKTVWSGPDNEEMSLWAIRKAFVHQLTNASGIWWFDMWGGWYHSERIMAEMKKMKDIAQASTDKASAEYPHAETVLFIDERAYLNVARGSRLNSSVNRIRVAMGNTGIPFDLCMVEDAPEVLGEYKAAVFTAPVPSDSGKRAIELCGRLGIPYISASEEKLFFELTELREFLISSGVHCYNSDGCVIYAGGGFVGVHSIKDGEVRVTLPKKFRVLPLFGICPEVDTDAVILNMKKYETVIFELQ